MERFNSMRAADCRVGLNLTLNYVANLLRITEDELKAIEEGTLYPEIRIVNFMLEIYGCSKEYLLSESEECQTVILARNGAHIAESDQKQVLEFLAFQKQISRQVYDVN
ncbi:helix-turn-helix domain-containing protein [Paenibacillus sp. WLX2291]|uniref:helix-turn-helix domain-containing protein n=1 Tax=Paenibacillus sp. WLX2291 TaxID=3296934 RepID=UPI003983DFCF